MPLATLVAVGVVFGTVTIGPLTPVCRVGTPCTGPAKNVIVTFTRAGRSVSTKTDPQGRYSVRLRVGTWDVRARVGMRSTPATVVVRPGSHRANLSIDTGIR